MNFTYSVDGHLVYLQLFAIRDNNMEYTCSFCCVFSLGKIVRIEIAESEYILHILLDSAILSSSSTGPLSYLQFHWFSIFFPTMDIIKQLFFFLSV